MGCGLVPLEIPYPIGFPSPPWNSSTSQTSNGVWEFQWNRHVLLSWEFPDHIGNPTPLITWSSWGIGFPMGFGNSNKVGKRQPFWKDSVLKTKNTVQWIGAGATRTRRSSASCSTGSWWCSSCKVQFTTIHSNKHVVLGIIIVHCIITTKETPGRIKKIDANKLTNKIAFQIAIHFWSSLPPAVSYTSSSPSFSTSVSSTPSSSPSQCPPNISSPVGLKEGQNQLVSNIY